MLVVFRFLGRLGLFLFGWISYRGRVLVVGLVNLVSGVDMGVGFVFVCGVRVVFCWLFVRF